MKIKLLALDMDGTTMMSDHVTLSPANRRAIKAAVARGIIVVTATGRMRNRIPEPIGEIAGLRYAVTSNGAAVCDLLTGETLYSNPLPKESALRVFEVLDGLGLYIEGYCEGNDYADVRKLPLFDAFPFSEPRKKMMSRNRFMVDDLPAFLRETPMPIEKINIPHIACELQDEVHRRLLTVPGISVTSSVSQNAEVNIDSANKADGLSHLCAHLGIKPEQVMAIGDNGNDIELLQFAGFSAAPSNGTPAAKAAASYIGPSNDDDCVARVIEKYLL